MSDKPVFGLSVADLGRSVRFYRDQIGLDVATDAVAPNTAVLTTAQQQRFLIAGPDAPGWTELLAEEHTVLRRGEKVFMGDPDFADRLERLSRNGAVAFELIERPWGDRIVEAVCPDGYGVSLWEIRERSCEEILELVQLARDGFRGIVCDLGHDDQCWRPGPDEWSGREVVHHVADTSLTVLHAARVALAEPGKTYHGNPFDQRLYAAELRYQEREIEPSLQMIESIHDTLLSLISAVPDPWERSITTPGGGKTNMVTYLLMMATHNLEHLEQINDIREQLGYSRTGWPIQEFPASLPE